MQNAFFDGLSGKGRVGGHAGSRDGEGMPLQWMRDMAFAV
jgi:hypothetical protein